MPLVSVVIPTLDRLALLQETIASVQRQTVTDWELVVVDDGSTDGTRAFLSSHPEPRLVPLLRPTRATGPSSTRNAGAAIARGRFVAFLDSDDLFLPVKLEQQLAALERVPGARWSVTAFAMLTERGEVRSPPVGSGRAVRSGWAFDDLIRERGSAAVQTLMVERSLFVESGGFDESLPHFEDTDLVLRLAERAPVASVREPLVLIREHPGRSAHTERDVLTPAVLAFDKIVGRARDERRRRLCRRAYARTLCWIAHAEAARGALPLARTALDRARRLTPWSLRVWRAAATLLWARHRSRPRSRTAHRSG